MTIPGKARTHSEPVSAVVHGTWHFDFETGNEESVPGSDFWWEQETSTKRYLTPQHGAQVTNLGERTAAFNEIDYVYATRLTYSTAKIDGSTTNNHIPDGTVLLWRSAEGNYVKMRIDTYGYDLSFTYEILGPVALVSTVVHGTWYFDFEMNHEGSAPGTDFWWEQESSTKRYLTPQHGAKIVNLGTTTAYNDVDFVYATRLTYSTVKIDGSTTNNHIPEGTVLLWRSAEGNYIKMRIDTYGYDLSFTYEILSPDDTVVVYGTWFFDFETGQQGSSPDTDFWWEQETSTKRYLTPQHGAQVTNLGTLIAYNDVTYAYAEGLTYSTTKVDGSTTNNQIPEGTVLVWRSAEGNYVKMLIASYGYDLCFIYEIIKPTIFTIVSPILTPIITGITPITTETGEEQPGIPGWEFYIGIIAIVTLLCFRRRRSN